MVIHRQEPLSFPTASSEKLIALAHLCRISRFLSTFSDISQEDHQAGSKKVDVL